MGKNQKKKKQSSSKKHNESVFQEAWENMQSDLSKIMPDPLLKLLQIRKRNVWMMALFIVFELVLIGFVGKLIYDWFVK